MDITVSANAKINLYLDITGIRSDGYHNIKTVMHMVDLHDSVTVSPAEAGTISITCDKPYVPTDERNIAYKAAKHFFSAIGKNGGVTIAIKKNIPVGGGLGGSSTDGAAVLSGLNYIFGKPLSENELLSLSASLGADVPFCLKKGAALCEGIGEIMTPLPTLKSTFAVIVKPPFSLNTKEMYERFDALAQQDASPSDISSVIDAVKSNDQGILCRSLYNAFYSAAKKMKPEISKYISALEESGADGVSMSGSGSCLFGIFTSAKKAESARELLKSSGFSAFLTRLI